MTSNDLRALRTAAGLTQQALADKIGVKVLAVRRWEAGTRRISALAERALKQECELAQGRTFPHWRNAPTIGNVNWRRKTT